MLYKFLPVIPAQGGEEVALGLYCIIKILPSIEFACAACQPGPCVRALCEVVALLLSKNMTCARPLQCNAKRTISSHFTSARLTPCTAHFTLALHTPHFMHFTLYVAFFTPCISNHILSCELFSSQLFSSHPISSHMSSK